MLFFAVDDERLALNEAQCAIAEAAPEAEIMTFLSASDALDTIKNRGLSPDVVFSDIKMSGMSGLEFAEALQTVSPDTRVVFVTRYKKYAVDDFRVRAQGYILKPLKAELVREELRRLPAKQEKLTVRCFGCFEVFWRGEPLTFQRRKTKELFAYLIDRRGAECTAEQIIAALWKENGDRKAAKQRVRNLIGDLKSTLGEIGMGDVLIRRGSRVAIRPDRVDCDYYRMLAGDMDGIGSFRGEYMVDYSWAELTAGTLFFKVETDT